MLGLGPYDSVSLGKILNDAIRNEALTDGAWWAFAPAMVLITVIAFALYVLNTSMEGVFNPAPSKVSTMTPVLEVDDLRVHYLTRFGGEDAGGRRRLVQLKKGEILGHRRRVGLRQDHAGQRLHGALHPAAPSHLGRRAHRRQEHHRDERRSRTAKTSSVGRSR